MLTVILAAAGTLVSGVLLGWWLGYCVGNDDGAEGVWQCWPWSKAERVD